MMKYQIILLISILISGCVSQPVQQAEVKQAIEITNPDSVKPIAITKVAATLRRGTTIGSLGSGWLCIGTDDIKWRSGNRVYLGSEDLVDIFREELESKGWPVVGSTEDLFEGYDVSGAEVLVAARITDIDSELCAPNVGFGNWDVRGSLRMNVEWQVYSPARRSLIGKIETEGSAEEKKTGDDTAYLLLSDAFALAANNLIANNDFLTLVERSSGLAQSPDIRLGALIENRKENYQTLEAAIAAVKKSTVTIRVANAHGSGVAIGDGSYVLTNAHVVGDAKNVTIVTGEGIELNAQVQELSKERDIALLILNSLRLPTIHINTILPTDGSPVYAIGSPLNEQLSGSVTSGIVSGSRIMEGYEWIQSDVSINPGNSGGPLINEDGSIIGISTVGFQAGGSQVGLNLFIPIGDALAFSGLRVD